MNYFDFRNAYCNCEKNVSRWHIWKNKKFCMKNQQVGRQAGEWNDPERSWGKIFPRKFSGAPRDANFSQNQVGNFWFCRWCRNCWSLERNLILGFSVNGSYGLRMKILCLGFTIFWRRFLIVGFMVLSARFQILGEGFGTPIFN